MLENVLINPDPIQSVKLTVPADVDGLAPYYQSGFHGITMADADSGEEVILDVSQRTWQLNVGALTAVVGTVLYITSAGVLTNSGSGNRAFGRVVAAKDANDIADVLILPQSGVDL
jgi:hypothetical protein